MDKKKVLFVWQSNWPWDIRIDKEIKVLNLENYSSAIISRNIENSPTHEISDNVEIFRIPTLSGNKKLNNFLSTPFYLNPIWFISIFNAIIKFKPDLIVIRDIPLALSTLFFAKLFKIKTIIDMAEPYPALIKVNDKFMNNPFTRFLFKTLNLYAYIEKRAVKNCDHVFVVVEDQVERLVKECNIYANKISIVSNTPFLDTLSNRTDKSQNNVLKIVYTGNVDGTFRDIPTVIKAMSILKNYPVEFNIVGGGSYIPRLKKMSENLNLSNVKFLGTMPFKELLEYLNTQDIGIVPHDNCDYIKYTIPNKIFDYMAHSLPVLVPSVKPLERIVNNTDCGYVYNVCNENSLADIIKYIISNKDELNIKGENGYNAIKNKYNWEQDSKIMLAAIKKLWTKNNV